LFLGVVLSWGQLQLVLRFKGARGLSGQNIDVTENASYSENSAVLLSFCILSYSWSHDP
jgi:hypothetical protein